MKYIKKEIIYIEDSMIIFNYNYRGGKPKSSFIVLLKDNEKFQNDIKNIKKINENYNIIDLSFPTLRLRKEINVVDNTITFNIVYSEYFNCILNLGRSFGNLTNIPMYLIKTIFEYMYNLLCVLNNSKNFIKTVLFNHNVFEFLPLNYRRNYTYLPEYDTSCFNITGIIDPYNKKPIVSNIVRLLYNIRRVTETLDIIQKSFDINKWYYMDDDINYQCHKDIRDGILDFFR